MRCARREQSSGEQKRGELIPFRYVSGYLIINFSSGLTKHSCGVNEFRNCRKMNEFCRKALHDNMLVSQMKSVLQSVITVNICADDSENTT